MKTVQNTIQCSFNVGDTLKFVSGKIITIINISPCFYTSCPEMISRTCTGYYLHDTRNHRWHDIRGDFVRMKKMGGE